MENTLLISCLIAGVMFATLAVWLMSRKGNTISEILKVQGNRDLEALKVEIMDKFKISTNIPIVAMFAIAAFVAIGLPGLSLWLSQHEYRPLYLKGIVEKAMHKNAYLTSPNMNIESSGAFTVPILPDHSGGYRFNIESDHYYPATVDIAYNEKNNTVQINSTAEELRDMQLAVPDTAIINLGRIIHLKEAPVKTVANRPSALDPTEVMPVLPNKASHSTLEAIERFIPVRQP